MKAKLETTATITLELNTQEAQYLHRIMQNNEYSLDNDEPNNERIIREDLFHNTDPTNFTTGS